VPKNTPSPLGVQTAPELEDAGTHYDIYIYLHNSWFQVYVPTVDGSEIPNNHLGCITPCKKNEINYQAQLVSRISSINNGIHETVNWHGQDEVVGLDIGQNIV